MSFCFQAEDGIRYYKVTGVQTCALPICFLCRWCIRLGRARVGRIVRGCRGRAVGAGDEREEKGGCESADRHAVAPGLGFRTQRPRCNRLATRELCKSMNVHENSTRLDLLDV